MYAQFDETHTRKAVELALEPLAEWLFQQSKLQFETDPESFVHPEPIDVKALLLDVATSDVATLSAVVLPQKSGRGPHGNLRNFAAMKVEKLRAVAIAIAGEHNDAEALLAANAELARRFAPA
jgi:hypothetical protein